MKVKTKGKGKKLAFVMNMLFVFLLSVTLDNKALAGLDERIAASFAAKYQVCAFKLKDTPGYRLKALGLKAKSDEIGRDKIGGGGYIETFVTEKKKAWALSLKKCKKFANNI